MAYSRGKSMDLCVPCAEKVKDVFVLKLVRHKGKITCTECGRRRYGCEYEATKKGGGQK